MNNNNENEKLIQLRMHAKKLETLAKEYGEFLQGQLTYIEQSLKNGKIADENIAKVESLENALKVEISYLTNFTNYQAMYNKLTVLHHYDGNDALGDLAYFLDDLYKVLEPLSKVTERKAVTDIIDKYEKKMGLDKFEQKIKEKIEELDDAIIRLSVTKPNSAELNSLEAQKNNYEEVYEAIKLRNKNDVGKQLSKLCDVNTPQTERDGIYKRFQMTLDKGLAQLVEPLLTVMDNDIFKEWFENAHPNLNHKDHIVKDHLKEIEDILNSVKGSQNAILDKKYQLAIRNAGYILDNNKITDLVEYIDNPNEVIIIDNDEDEKEKKSGKWKKPLAILVAVGVAAGAIGVTLKSNKTDSDKKNNDNTNDDSYTDEVDEDVVLSETVMKLMDLGYTQSEANEIINLVATYVSLGYTEGEAYEKAFAEIEFSIEDVEGYNKEYKAMYRFVTDNFAVTNEQTVDYVNRAYQIKETNYFGDDCSVEDILLILMSINNKKIIYVDDANLLNNFDTASNKIENAYLWGTTIDENTTKEETLAIYVEELEALKLVATEGSDLDKFLTNYTELAQDILKDPDNLEKKEKLLNYLEIFVTSFNGFNNDKTVLTNDSTFNSNATVNDAYDFMIAAKITEKMLSIMDALDPDTDTMDIDMKILTVDMSDQLADGLYDRYDYIIKNYSSSKSLQDAFTKEELSHIALLYYQHKLQTAMSDDEIIKLCSQNITYISSVELTDAVSAAYSDTQTEDNDYSRTLGR